MGAFSQLGSLGTKLLGNSGARMLSGAGLSLLSYAALKAATIAALALVVSHTQSLPSAVLQIVLLAGFGEFLSIVGAALLTKAALASGRLGVGKATGT